MALPPRKIGSSLVHPIGYGAMGMSVFYGPGLSDEEAFKVLDRALELGCTHLDTAALYKDSEEVIRRWLKKSGNRDKVYIATKFTIDQKTGQIRGDPEFVREQWERLSKRLGVDCIDLFYQHRPDPKMPIEVTVGAMAELVKEGKVKHISLSEVSAKDIRCVHKIHPISAIQIEFSPFVLDIEDEKVGILRVACELGITIVCYSPLGRGLVTGRYKSPDDLAEDDFRRTIPKYSKENFPKILKVVDELQEIGKKHGATSGQVALSWILAQGDDFVVIPGMKSIKYLEENMGAVNVRLTEEEINAVRKIAESAAKNISGDRYDKVFLEMTLADTPELP